MASEATRETRSDPDKNRPEAPQEGDEGETYVTVRELVDRARQGDRTVLPALDQLLDRAPKFVEQNSQLAWSAHEKWIALISGDDLVVHASLIRKINELRAGLLEEGAGTIAEEMLAEVVVSTYLQLRYHELKEGSEPAESVALGEFRLKKLESAQGRHVKAIKALKALGLVKLTADMAGKMRLVTMA